MGVGLRRGVRVGDSVAAGIGVGAAVIVGEGDAAGAGVGDTLGIGDGLVVGVGGEADVAVRRPVGDSGKGKVTDVGVRVTTLVGKGTAAGVCESTGIIVDVGVDTPRCVGVILRTASPVGTIVKAD